MSDEISIRSATAGDAGAISALIRSLVPYSLADPEDLDAAAPFLATVTADAVRGYITSTRFRYDLAEIGDGVVGAVAVRDACHVYHLFVDERLHRRGIGGRLWRTARAAAIAAGNPGRFSVYSSLHALPVYAAFGFEATGPAVVQDGVVFLPMELDESERT